MLQDLGFSDSEEVAEFKRLLQNEIQLRKAAEEEVNKLKSQLGQFMQPAVWIYVDYRDVILPLPGFCLFLSFVLPSPNTTSPLFSKPPPPLAPQQKKKGFELVICVVTFVN